MAIKKDTLDQLVDGRDVRRLAASAIKGDIGSAVLLLKMRAHAAKHGGSGPMIIRIIGGLPENWNKNSSRSDSHG